MERPLDKFARVRMRMTKPCRLGSFCIRRKPVPSHLLINLLHLIGNSVLADVAGDPRIGR